MPKDKFINLHFSLNISFLLFSLSNCSHNVLDWGRGGIKSRGWLYKNQYLFLLYILDVFVCFFNYTAAQHRSSTLCVSRVNTTVKDSFLPFATLTNLSGNL